MRDSLLNLNISPISQMNDISNILSVNFQLNIVELVNRDAKLFFALGRVVISKKIVKSQYNLIGVISLWVVLDFNYAPWMVL